MNRKDLVVKNPIGAQVFLNIIVSVLLLATLGVMYVAMTMKNRPKHREVQKLEKQIKSLTEEIDLLRLDIKNQEDLNNMAEIMKGLEEQGVQFRSISPSEVTYLPSPSVRK